MNLKISIVINNYNYAQWLQDAIESALSQTFSNIEVIVVDDGSTDTSRDIIEKYVTMGSIIPVFKKNGGQASAFNCGFLASSGDIVIFLDADDVLFPNACGEVAEVWNSSLAKIQWMLNLTDEMLQPLRKVYPIWKVYSNQNVATILAKYSWYPFSPTSGNAFSRWYLKEILPLSEEPWRISADLPLNLNAPFYGKVKFIDKILGYYRQHGKQHTRDSVFYRNYYHFLLEKQRILRDGCKRCGLHWSKILAPPDYRCLLINSFSSTDSNVKKHTIALKGAYSVVRYPYFTPIQKLLYFCWFIIAGYLPKIDFIKRHFVSFQVFDNYREKYDNLADRTIQVLKQMFNF